MENLIINQTEIYESMTKLLSNFKKESPDRKTVENCKRRLITLETYWKEYQVNHEKLCQIGVYEHDYFKKRVYDEVAELYEKVRGIIEKAYQELIVAKDQQAEQQKQKVEQQKQEAEQREQQKQKYQVMKEPQPRSLTECQPIASTSAQQAVQQQSSTSNSGGSNKLDELIKKQNINFRAFQRTASNINLEAMQNKWEFEDSLKSIQARWTIIDELHWEIQGEIEEEDYRYETEFSKYEQRFNDLKKAINNKLWSTSHREKSTPKLDIPFFNGNYHQWVSFKDLFTEAIHNNPSLSNAQKMQFLKNKIKGEAERLIQHLHISSDNYNVCWDILNHRYDNKRLIFTSHANIFLNIPAMQQQSLGQIKKLHDVTKECLHAIENLGVDISNWDPLLVHILSQKLDSDSYAEYLESVNNPRELPILKEFLDFLESKFTVLESSRRKQEPASKINHQFTIKKQFNNSNINQKPSSNTNNYNTQPNKAYHIAKPNCGLCHAEHGLFGCNKFLELSDEQKLNTVTRLHYCVNCLYNHFNKPCISIKRCRKCDGKHNTILHEAFENQKQKQQKSTFKKEQPGASSSHASQEDTSEILLATALIKTTDAHGNKHVLRALIDQGSQISLISEKAAQLLALKRQPCKGTIFGVGESESNCKGRLNLECESMYQNFKFNTSALIMNNLIKNLPNQTLTNPTWPHIENLKLADPEFNISRPVDLLLGAEVYSKIMMGGILRGENDKQPIAQQTHLGWVLCGSVSTYQCNVVLHNYEDLHKFWDNEDITEKIDMSAEDYECLQHFKSNIKRQEDGRYQVRLPFKTDVKEDLGSTRTKALAQFRSLEKKLSNNSEISEQYKNFMHEYIELGHMKTAETNTTPECHLPHHAVTRAESTTTKLRVVFNASAASSNGISLNDILQKGPNLQQDLQDLIMKWRQYQFAFTSDIEKMFRMILVHPEDQVYQKIFWRDSPEQPIQSYQLTTVTYGTKSAPFLAMMTLKQLAEDERKKYPKAAKALEEQFYMDDFCGGGHSESEAKQLKADLTHLLQLGGFNLRKWASNKPSLLSDADTKQSSQQTFEFKQSDSTKTLGLGWNPQSDEFLFHSKIEPTTNNVATKRSLLSDISKLFDPLGWLTPVSTSMKILFQGVWLSNLEWDDALPEDINQKWISLRAELYDIQTFKINRWLSISPGEVVQLHGFCDASQRAYACVVYCRVIKKDTPIITMVAGKARLVPLNKEISTPRLELMGAQLLSKLMLKIKQSLSDHSVEIFGWSDSTAVLGWIQGNPEKWKPFVANRVKAITEVIPSNQWNYVNTQENPADCASRGLSVTQLKNHHLWWQGPSWLSAFEEKDQKQELFETTLEVKSSAKQTNAITVEQDESLLSDIINQLLTKYSSFTKINRILAWILRLKDRQAGRRPYLSINELRRAKMLIIKNVQQIEFSDDIRCLQKNGNVHSKSKILNLNPIIDQDGILRVGGRLKNANISPEMKHPIIIPHDHRLTSLIIQQAHELTFHGGARMTQSHIRQKYWVISGNNATKKQIRNCVTCRKRDPSKLNQIMGDLPAARINPESAFYHTGVDFTGFVDVKANKGRGIKTTKGYIAVFVCMVTKAVHLELVSDLSSSAFLAALSRMAARRGAPRHIYSDNGTNFVGANRMLEEQYQHLQSIFKDSFVTEISEMGIEWHFNAPSWPSAGGLWERAVRSLKHHLKRVVGESKLTFEEYTTLLAQLEACLNSRPLCPISEDPEDLEYLTPAHFLTTSPGLNIIETETDARTRWHLISKLLKDLWKRWKTEYLTQLSTRSKWLAKKENIKIGDLVVIHDDLPAGKWPMGRVIDTHPGADGMVRVVTLKTKNGIIKRPIVKLSLLPIRDEKQDKESGQVKATEEKQSKRSRPKRQTSVLATVATALLMFITLISPSSAIHRMYNISELSNNQSLYFDPISNMQLIRDKWNLIVYYDMEPYQNGLVTYAKISDYLQKLCTKIELESHCNMIMMQLKHDYTELQYYNELLLDQHYQDHARRRRRGLINGIGYVAGDLFGVLDARFAEQYTKDIELIKRNEKHLLTLWKNQTSVVEAEFNLVKRIEETIDKQHKFINRKLNSLESATNTLQQEIMNISTVQDFTLTAMAGSNLLQSLKRLQDTLLDTITDIYHGQISLHLLKPTQLRAELRHIYGQMQGDLTLPIKNIDTNLQQLYKLLRVKARITNQYIIFEIKFPLITREKYQLYQVIPVPLQVNSSMITITPVSEFLAVNLKKDSFFITSNTDLQSCIHQEDTLICETHKPIITLKTDEDFCKKNLITNQCEFTKEQCSNRWTELHSTSRYFYFCCYQYNIKIICDDQITQNVLSKAGILTMSPNCILKTKDLTIHSIQQHSDHITLAADVIVPKMDTINQIVNIQIPHEVMYEDKDIKQTISNITKDIEQMKSSGVDDIDLSAHDIHHYTITYVLLAAGVIAAGVWTWRKGWCARRPREARHQQQQAPTQESSSPQHQQQAPAPRPSVAPGPAVANHVYDSASVNEKVNLRLSKLVRSARYGQIKRQFN